MPVRAGTYRIVSLDNTNHVTASRGHFLPHGKGRADRLPSRPATDLEEGWRGVSVVLLCTHGRATVWASLPRSCCDNQSKTPPMFVCDSFVLNEAEGVALALYNGGGGVFERRCEFQKREGRNRGAVVGVERQYP